MRNLVLIALLGLAGNVAIAAEPARDASRGELLYTTHCVACHTTKVHWRKKKLATDWPTLKAQVRRWQSTSGQTWPDPDITEVAQYLNNLYYHYPAND